MTEKRCGERIVLFQRLDQHIPAQGGASIRRRLHNGQIRQCLLEFTRHGLTVINVNRAPSVHYERHTQHPCPYVRPGHPV